MDKHKQHKILTSKDMLKAFFLIPLRWDRWEPQFLQNSLEGRNILIKKTKKGAISEEHSKVTTRAALHLDPEGKRRIEKPTE